MDRTSAQPVGEPEFVAQWFFEIQASVQCTYEKKSFKRISHSYNYRAVLSHTLDKKGKGKVVVLPMLALGILRGYRLRCDDCSCPYSCLAQSLRGRIRGQNLPHHRARIFKLLRSAGIDSTESIPPAYVAWRAGTSTHCIPTRFLAPTDCLKIPAQLKGCMVGVWVVGGGESEVPPTPAVLFLSCVWNGDVFSQGL